ncbi:MAG TPA: hypothetical protein PK978_05145, partial [Paludibacter sp.]|nr:hypothetical protein [Paludibacter sp.]
SGEPSWSPLMIKIWLSQMKIDSPYGHSNSLQRVICICFNKQAKPKSHPMTDKAVVDFENDAIGFY